ncbi:uromodulin [Polymixia lowei]
MRVSGGTTLLLVFMQTVTRSTPETTVLSCETCHDQANCLDLNVKPERGDVFSSQAFSCVCKDGFVGDGLTCYNRKLCGDAPCCRQGYQWSPEKGCLDIDECSLPDPPCALPQVCQNTPGAYDCLAPPPHTKSNSGIDSSSVQFQCRNLTCPSGEDCIHINGTLRCVDPCEHHTILDDAWRATNYRMNGTPRCDRDVSWQGWYRLFLGQTSTRIPETCVDRYMCGTHAPLWITDPHPRR